MAEMKTHIGSCHCGKIRFEATTDLSHVVQCNCSMCSRAGYLLTFVPLAQFKVLAGSDDDLTDYRFNQHKIAHVFCKTCGVRSFSKGKMPDGTEMRAVNVRCLQDVDPDTLKITKYNGRDL